MEQRNYVYFANNYKNRHLYSVFVRGQMSGDGSNFRTAKEFEVSFNEVMRPEQSTNKYNADFKIKLEREMQKFNGKILVGEGAETNSEMTTATRNTRKSSQATQRTGAVTRFGSPSGGEELDEAATL
mmetsp:Transcript_2910/g.4499  ORF Transcript_2910/g.4499 Transcript_2910/m.4499 type:complete len:127 (-) Transcript_2910:870-1250(-)